MRESRGIDALVAWTWATIRHPVLRYEIEPKGRGKSKCRMVVFETELLASTHPRWSGGGGTAASKVSFAESICRGLGQ